MAAGHVAARDGGRTTTCSPCWPRRACAFTILAPSQADDDIDTRRPAPVGPPRRRTGRRHRLLRRRPVARPRLRLGRAHQRGAGRAGWPQPRATTASSWSPPTARRSATTTSSPTARSRSCSTRPRRTRASASRNASAVLRERPPGRGRPRPRERVVVRPRRGPVERGLRLPHRRRAGLEPALAGAAAAGARPAAGLRRRGVRAPGRRVLRDPWAARDDVPRRGARHPCRGRLRRRARQRIADDAVEALTLLEAQRHALLMYTSCGWFFNDLAGIETIQVLRYAARVIDLLAELGEAPPTDQFLAVLAEAREQRARRGRRPRHLGAATWCRPGSTPSGWSPTSRWWTCSSGASSRPSSAGSSGRARAPPSRAGQPRRLGRAGRARAPPHPAPHRARVRGRAPRRARGVRRRPAGPPRGGRRPVRRAERRGRGRRAGHRRSCASSAKASAPRVRSRVGAARRRRPDRRRAAAADLVDRFAQRLRAAVLGPPVDARPRCCRRATRCRPSCGSRPSSRSPGGSRPRSRPSPTPTTSPRSVPRGPWCARPAAAPSSWRRRSAAATMSRTVLAAVERAIAQPDEERVGAALGLLRLTVHLGLGLNLDRAQEVVYDALVAGAAEPESRCLAPRSGWPSKPSPRGNQACNRPSPRGPAGTGCRRRRSASGARRRQRGSGRRTRASGAASGRSRRAPSRRRGRTASTDR